MTVRGHVKDGNVVLEEPGSLPEGTTVAVRALKRTGKPPSDEAAPTVYERYKGFIGKAKGLPRDLSRNHDHYLCKLNKSRKQSGKDLYERIQPIVGIAPDLTTPIDR